MKPGPLSSWEWDAGPWPCGLTQCCPHGLWLQWGLCEVRCGVVPSLGQAGTGGQACGPRWLSPAAPRLPLCPGLQTSIVECLGPTTACWPAPSSREPPSLFNLCILDTPVLGGALHSVLGGTERLSVLQRLSVQSWGRLGRGSRWTLGLHPLCVAREAQPGVGMTQEHGHPLEPLLLGRSWKGGGAPSGPEGPGRSWRLPAELGTCHRLCSTEPLGWAVLVG